MVFSDHRLPFALHHVCLVLRFFKLLGQCSNVRLHVRGIERGPGERSQCAVRRSAHSQRHTWMLGPVPRTQLTQGSSLILADFESRLTRHTTRNRNLEDRAGVPDLIKLQVDFQRLLDTKQCLHLMKCSVFSGVTAKTKGVSQLDKWRRPQHWPDKSGCIEPTHPPPPHTVHPYIRPHFLAMRQRPPRDSMTGWAT